MQLGIHVTRWAAHLCGHVHCLLLHVLRHVCILHYCLPISHDGWEMDVTQLCSAHRAHLTIHLVPAFRLAFHMRLRPFRAL